MCCVFALLLLAPLLSPADEAAGPTLTIKVTNIPGAKGNLMIGIYDSEDSFTKTHLDCSPKIPLTTADDVIAKVPNLKPGTYAIAVFQDLNENGELDKNFVGMPKEPLAFSMITEIPKGKPKFEECAFVVGDTDVEMTIALTLE